MYGLLYYIWLFTPQTQTSSTDISNRWIIFRYYCCHLVTARENKQGGRMRATAQLFCYVLVSLTIKRLLFYTASKMDIICMLYYAITLSALIGLCVHHRPHKLHNRNRFIPAQSIAPVTHFGKNKSFWYPKTYQQPTKPSISSLHKEVFVTDIQNSRMLYVFSYLSKCMKYMKYMKYTSSVSYEQKKCL